MALVLLAVPPAAAYKDCNGQETTDANKDACTKTDAGTQKLVKGIQVIAGPIIGLVFVGSIFVYAMAGSNEKNRAGAKVAMMSAGIGLVLIMLAQPLVDFIRNAFA